MAPLLLLRERRDRRRATSSRTSTSRDRRPRSTRSPSGPTARAVSSSCGWAERPLPPAGRRHGPAPRGPRAGRAHAGAGDELLDAPQGPRELGPIPRRVSRCSCSPGASGPTSSWASRPTGPRRSPRASLFKSMKPESITLDEALALLSLPRVVGVDAMATRSRPRTAGSGPTSRRPPTAAASRRRTSSSRSRWTRRRRLRPAQAAAGPRREAAVRRPRRPPGVRRADPGARRSVRPVHHRRHREHGVPRGVDPEVVTVEQAVELLRERARAPATKTGRTAERQAKKAAVKKAAVKKAAARKPAKTKSTAKATAAKKATKPPAAGT